MVRFKKASIAVLGIIALAGCTKSESSVPDSTTVATTAAAPDAAADEQAIRAMNDQWFKAYSAHDVDGIVALYADDATVSMPNMPAARGRAAIRDAYQKDIQGAVAAGYVNTQGTSGESGASGDLAWESNTFTVTDKTGAKVESGKYVTVFSRRDGKWLIIRDIWNSDMPAAPTR